MESKTFSSQSLIYRFLAYPRNKLYNPPEDICELTRAVLFRVLLILLAVSVVGIYLSSVSYYLFSGFYGTNCGFDIKTITSACSVPGLEYYNGLYMVGGILSMLTVAALFIGALLLTIIGLCFLIDNFKEYARNRRYAKEKARLADPNYKEPVPRNNVFKAMYLSHKEKTCYRIKFE